MYCKAQHVQLGDIHPTYGTVTAVRPVPEAKGVRIQFGAFHNGYFYPTDHVVRVTRHLTNTASLHRKVVA